MFSGMRAHRAGAAAAYASHDGRGRVQLAGSISVVRTTAFSSHRTASFASLSTRLSCASRRAARTTSSIGSGSARRAET